jgi:phage shock protein A
MGESVSSRVGRVLAGGFNKMVEAIEGAAPDAVLEQTVREIEGAIEQVRSELGREIAAKHLATRRLFEANKKHDDLRERIDLAIQSRRDDLAEAAVALQLDIEAQIPVIEHAMFEIGEREKELDGYLRALQGRVREMREELMQYRTQRDAQRGASSPESHRAGSNGDAIRTRVERAEAAFDRMLQRVTGVVAGASPSDADTATKLAELEQLTRSNRIKERLAAYKTSSTGVKNSGADEK